MRIYPDNKIIRSHSGIHSVIIQVKYSAHSDNLFGYHSGYIFGSNSGNLVL